jgi:hypothetical protein
MLTGARDADAPTENPSAFAAFAANNSERTPNMAFDIK